MRMKSLILIFIALGCGLVASIGISQVMDRGGSGNSTMEMEQILVALTDIDIGTKLDAQNVKLEDWPKAKVPEGAIRRVDEVKDKFANARFFKGEPIHISKVADNQGGNFTLKIQQGYRVMPVKVDEDTVMKGISPGDRVDVIVFLRRNGDEVKVTGAFPILKNVRVFAVNTNTERAIDSKGETSNFRTVSLLVKEEHQGELVVASQMGKIMLSLRRPDETDDILGEEVTPIKDILAGGSKLGSDPRTTPGGNTPGVLGIFKGSSQPIGPSPASGAPPKWRMMILGPVETQQFEWFDDNDFPVKSTLASHPGMPISSGNNQPSGPSEGETLDDDDQRAAPDTSSGSDKAPPKGK
jgi:pilus assembly protein CpaB